MISRKIMHENVMCCKIIKNVHTMSSLIKASHFLLALFFDGSNIFSCIFCLNSWSSFLSCKSWGLIRFQCWASAENDYSLKEWIFSTVCQKLWTIWRAPKSPGTGKEQGMGIGWEQDAADSLASTSLLHLKVYITN